jgi:hypothetical protein
MDYLVQATFFEWLFLFIVSGFGVLIFNRPEWFFDAPEDHSKLVNLLKPIPWRMYKH